MVQGDTKVGDLVCQLLDKRIDLWEKEAQIEQRGAVLGYQSSSDGRTVALLHKPEEVDWNTFTCLNSLRDVEPMVRLILRDHSMDQEPT